MLSFLLLGRVNGRRTPLSVAKRVLLFRLRFAEFACTSFIGDGRELRRGGSPGHNMAASSVNLQ
jgi:hypothetical protein